MRALSHSRLNLTASLFLATRIPKSGTPVSVGALTTILRIASAAEGITDTVAGDVDLIRYTKPSSPGNRYRTRHRFVALSRSASIPCIADLDRTLDLRVAIQHELLYQMTGWIVDRGPCFVPRVKLQAGNQDLAPSETLRFAWGKRVSADARAGSTIHASRRGRNRPRPPCLRPNASWRRRHSAARRRGSLQRRRYRTPLRARPCSTTAFVFRRPGVHRQRESRGERAAH